MHAMNYLSIENTGYGYSWMTQNICQKFFQLFCVIQPYPNAAFRIEKEFIAWTRFGLLELPLTFYIIAFVYSDCSHIYINVR